MEDRFKSAYREAVYQFSYQGVDYHIEVAKKNKRIDQLLDSLGADSATFITAYNPQSLVLSKAENSLNQKRLVERVEQMGLNYMLGFSTDRCSSWPKEASLFITDLDFDRAVQLAAEFDQKGFLYIQSEQTVRLCFVDEERASN